MQTFFQNERLFGKSGEEADRLGDFWMIRKEKATLLAIYFTFFMDYLSWAIVFPIFAPLFLDKGNHLFSPDVQISTRTAVLGLFLMAFSLGQFIGAPLVGGYADRHGRRVALIWSVFFTFVAFAMTAWSVGQENLYILFLARIIAGFFASNMSICLSSIADLTENESEKVKRFGHLSLLGGIAFILGAFLGGKSSDPTLSSYFSPSLPLWAATGLTVLNFGFVLWGFHETSVLSSTRHSFTFLDCLRDIREALRTEKIKSIYLIYFLFLFAWTMLFQFTPVLLVRLFFFTNSNIGDLALFMGVCWAIGSGYLNKILLKYFAPLRILEVCLFLFTAFVIFLIFPTHIYEVLGIVAICVMIGGLAWPLCNGLISSTAPSNMQGKTLGISQSIQSLAMAIAPVLGGITYSLFEGFPFLLGAVASFVAGTIYFTLKDR